MDGQLERTMQTLEDRLRSCILNFKDCWEQSLPLIEFAYNNNYIRPSRCRPLRHCMIGATGHYCVAQVGEKRLLRLKVGGETSETVQLIRARLRTVQSRQKSYADWRRHYLEFSVGDHVFLKLSPTKGVMRFGKLSPRYIDPFEILECISQVAYKLALPPHLSSIHNFFNVSMLCKYEPYLSQVITY